MANQYSVYFGMNGPPPGGGGSSYDYSGGYGSPSGGSMFGGALAGAAGGLASSALANHYNKKAAKRQMKFQKEMRATQYQTAVKDMRKAGINPMLAYMKGGAGNLSGTSIPAQNPQLTESAAKGTSSAIASKIAREQLDLYEHQINKARNDSFISKAQAHIMGNASYLSDLSLPFLEGVQDIKNNSKTLQNAAAWLAPTGSAINSASKLFQLIPK